ncbi:MAG: hypothetical protein JW880_08255, partial [Candidatus Thermoplasmatota archaeon]|nr:hypothetical protein [Candidatus Thermoplasmatota archaeon]
MVWNCSRRLSVGLAVFVAVALSMPVGLFFVAEAPEPMQSEETVLRMGFLQEIDSLNPYLGLNEVS